VLTWLQMAPQLLEPKVASVLEWRRSGERKLPKPGAVKVLQTFEDGVAVGMEDCDQCLAKDNLAALVGKRAQTDEGMEKRRHDMARHCCWG
jgi:hypothetical protein